jgi:hypothetical protein
LGSKPGARVRFSECRSNFPDLAGDEELETADDLHFAFAVKRRRKSASVSRSKNASVKLARRAGNLGPFLQASGFRPIIRRGVSTGAA